MQPVESLALPEHLDGRDGTNRGAPETAQLAARHDLDAVRAWLSNYADTQTTFEAYRKEAERLMLWAVVQLGKPLSSLTHEDLQQFNAFLADPQPASRWVSRKDDGSIGGKYPRGDARWRPFNGPLSAASQRQARVILNGLFTWLVNAGYLRGNPMALLRQRAKRSAPRITRYLSVSLWDEVKRFVEQLPQETAAQRAYAARCRWLTTLFYLQGLRLSEVAHGTMGDFSRRLGPDGQDPWEDTPLVVPFRGPRRGLSRSALHDAIKRIFRDAASWLRARGPAFADRADELVRASAHWLRHTAGSHQADAGLDLRTVRDNLGHVSLTTTSLYLHEEEDMRHRQTVRGHRMNWSDGPPISPNGQSEDGVTT
nr:tyrosine-type recombinase/integrase [Mycetohabitans endofungorum]